MHADITQFHGETRWLSNFWIIPGGITYRGLHAETTEHLYQALKCVRLEDALWILESKSPRVAKRRGHEIELNDPSHIRQDWSQAKVRLMAELTALKFQEPGLRQKLVDTGGALIIEGNPWHDTFWGCCNCGGHKGHETEDLHGQNNLGRILMVERALIYAGERDN